MNYRYLLTLVSFLCLRMAADVLINFAVFAVRSRRDVQPRNPCRGLGGAAVSFIRATSILAYFPLHHGFTAVTRSIYTTRVPQRDRHALVQSSFKTLSII